MNQHDINGIHDVLIYIYGVSFCNETIISLMESLPSHIKNEAASWGWPDTVVRDSAYVYWENNFRENIKVYLDDERKTPEGWFRVYWPNEVIGLLSVPGLVQEISLDHDLGDDERGTGYDVVLWIEKEVHENGYKPPLMSVHSANVSARKKMESGISSIMRYIESHE